MKKRTGIFEHILNRDKHKENTDTVDLGSEILDEVEKEEGLIEQEEALDNPDNREKEEIKPEEIDFEAEVERQFSKLELDENDVQNENGLYQEVDEEEFKKIMMGDATSLEERLTKAVEMLGLPEETSEEGVSELLKKMGIDIPDLFSDESLEVVEIAPMMLDIFVTPDKMAAHLSISNIIVGQPPLEIEQIEGFLANKGITYGILRNDIEKYCFAGDYEQELVLAKGTEAIKGEDGKAIFYFDVNPSNVPKELGDGSVDFKDISTVQNVNSGDLLCQIIPPKPGVPGMNIFNQEVPPPPVKEATVKAGNHVTITDDQLQYYADMEGCIRYTKGTITIEEVYKIPGDVGPETGNIEFNGIVIITGNVLDGFSVLSQKDIIITGRVGGAEIMAGGNVVISSGMNGTTRGSVMAGGDVTAKYLENANVVCKGNFYCDCALNSKVKAGKSIIMSGKRGSLLGGEYKAGESIEVKDLSNPTGVATVAILSPQWYEVEMEGMDPKEIDYVNIDLEELKTKIIIGEKESQILIEGVQQIISGAKHIEPEKRTAYIRQSVYLREQKMKEVIAMKSRLARALEYMNNQDFSVTVRGNAYPGSKIVIQGEIKKIGSLQTYQKYYLLEGEIIGAIPNKQEKNDSK